MRKLYVFFAFLMSLFLISEAFAYDARHEWYMNFVANVPRQLENNPKHLAKYLAYPMRNDYDRAQAFAYWIAMHIIYDRYLYNNGKGTKLLKNYKGQTPKEIIKNRVGICNDFARLFDYMCKETGVKSGIIRGYVLEERERKSENARHAWNYFMYRGRKVYVDTTFMGEGKLTINGYVSRLERKRAIQKHVQKNQRKSVLYPVTPYYFDFSYKDEYIKRGHKRIEGCFM